MRRQVCGRKWNAFTLVELIAAAAILTILIVLVSFGLSSVQAGVQRAKCLENMRGVGRSIMVYASENDSRYPLTENNAWDVPLASYWDGDSNRPNPALRCPADKRPLVVNGAHFSRSYSLNANLPEKAANIQQPAKTIMLAEWYTGDTGPGGASANYQFQPGYSLVEYHLVGLPIEYHKKVSNFIFCDGHAASYQPEATLVPESLWTLR